MRLLSHAAILNEVSSTPKIFIPTHEGTTRDEDGITKPAILAMLPKPQISQCRHPSCRPLQGSSLQHQCSVASSRRAFIPLMQYSPPAVGDRLG